MSKYVLLLLTLLLACRQNTKLPPPQPAPEPPAAPSNPGPGSLSLSQVDSIATYQNKPLPASLGKALFADAASDTAAIHLLTGQLDADPEPEKVVWFKDQDHITYGFAAVLDFQNDHWKTLEPVPMGFRHGDDPPKLDAKTGTLQIYHYGSGSSYGSKVLDFYRLVDGSLITVLQFLEWEGAVLNGLCGATKTLTGTYRCKGKDVILTSYRYTVRESAEEGKNGRIIFQSRINIPFHWSAAEKAYLPKVPAGFPDEDLDLSDGEFSFDQYFDPMLQRVKTHGPKWKRLALCNQEEE